MGKTFRFDSKSFLVLSVNMALNIRSTVAKSLMRQNLIQRRTRSFVLLIALLVTFSSFLCCCCCCCTLVFYDSSRVQFGVRLELV